MVNISIFSMFASLKFFCLSNRVGSVIFRLKFYQLIDFRCFLIVFRWQLAEFIPYCLVKKTIDYLGFYMNVNSKTSRYIIK